MFKSAGIHKEFGCFSVAVGRQTKESIPPLIFLISQGMRKQCSLENLAAVVPCSVERESAVCFLTANEGENGFAAHVLPYKIH